MSKRSALILAALFCASCAAATSGLAVFFNPLRMKELAPFNKNDRVLVLAPHPDDETIGCAGVIQQALSRGAKVRVLYLTNGDNNHLSFLVYEKRPPILPFESARLGKIRSLEATRGMQLLGLKKEDLIFLGYPDFGTFSIFYEFWQKREPFMSWVNRISSVPYKDCLSFGAPYTGESILNDIKKVLIAYKPNKIFVSHPADSNVDHRAFYLFLQVALADLARELPGPKVWPYLIHCPGWPMPRNYNPELILLPPQKFLNSGINWLWFGLTQGQLDEKYKVILSYPSQTGTSAFYLMAFARKNELFGDYPQINFYLFELRKLYRKFFLQKHLILEHSRVRYDLGKGSLLIRIAKTHDTYKRIRTSAYLFGYSNKVPFADMPKIYITTQFDKIQVFEKGRPIACEGVRVKISEHELVLNIPFELLGNPDFVLASVAADTASWRDYTTGFRKINLKRRPYVGAKNN